MSDYGSLVPNGSTRFGASDASGYVPGRVYVPSGMGATVNGNAIAVGTMHLGFGSIKEAVAISHLGARLLTASAGGNFQLAVYAHNPVTGAPGKLVASTGLGSTAAVAIVNIPLGASQTLGAGAYWFALAVDNATATFVNVGGGATAFAAAIGSPTAAILAASTAQPAGYTTLAAFGTWPSDLAGATLTEVAARAPLIQFLVASVP